MPIHEYACASCGETFEELILRASDEADLRCPRCGGREPARQLSSPAGTSGSRGKGGASPRACGPFS
ncbi:MAG TPA: zinc ribbon domain-containing protein [Anaeromyxobacteraceae bacterium]|nr:zinc ribbon domain-containing protein [Anaeromyxobacteraceae bacterium]